MMKPVVDSSTKDPKSIELTIEKKRPKTPANVKRTPFEEDNYLASAWSKPLHLPLPSGPRCLRVQGPSSGMEITNLTNSVSNGRAIEGTVNRICLKLQAGNEEVCSEIKFKVTCSTTIVMEDGTTKTLSAEESSEGNTIPMKNAGSRTPVLVAVSPQSKSTSSTDYGFDIPVGWEQVGGSGQEDDDSFKPHTQSLACGETTYAFFELYRPTALTPGGAVPASISQTDFEVTVSYRQERKGKERDSINEQKGTDDSIISEVVTQKFSGSVLWTPPIVASFQRGSRNSTPSGSRHPSNLTDDDRPSGTSVFTEIPVVDGETVSIRSTLEANPILDGVAFEVGPIRFEVSLFLTVPRTVCASPTPF